MVSNSVSQALGAYPCAVGLINEKQNIIVPSLFFYRKIPSMKLLLQELTQCWIDSDNEGHCFHQKQMLERTGQQKSLLWYGLKFLLLICRGLDVYMYINSHLVTR